jgi:hypothetical protein
MAEAGCEAPVAAAEALPGWDMTTSLGLAPPQIEQSFVWRQYLTAKKKIISPIGKILS